MQKYRIQCICFEVDVFSVPMDGVEQKPILDVEVYNLVSQVGWKSGGLPVKCHTLFCKKSDSVG
jgi:hypothetical protein